MSSAAAASAPGRSRPPRRRCPLGRQPAGLPARQFAWTATLATDSHGNAISPRYDRLLFFDVLHAPTAIDVRRLEAALRTLERAYPWGPEGLLFTAGWGPHYFEHVLGARSPIPRPKGLSDFELPTFDDYDLCLHLACDNEQRLAEIELALVNGKPLPGQRSVDLSGSLRWRETRTGFVGTGLPAAHQNANGIPPGKPGTRQLAAVHGLQVGLQKEPGQRGRRHDHRRAVRRRNDDAGQLHAPPPRQLVRNPRRERARRAHVRPRDHPGRGRRASPTPPPANPAATHKPRPATASSGTPRPPPAPAATGSRGSSAATSTPSTAASPASTSSRSSAASPTSSRPETR